MSTEIEKKSFVLYADYEDTIRELNRTEQGLLFANIFHYVNNTELEPMSRLVRIVFQIIRRQIDRDTQKYTDAAERSRINGHKGGRPKGKKPPETQNNPEKPAGSAGLLPKPAEPVNETENENHNDSDNESENEPVRVISPPAASAPEKTRSHTRQKKPSEKTLEKSLQTDPHMNYIQYARHVSLSEEQHRALNELYGPEVTGRLIEIVSDYKGMRPERYENYNDFYAIKSWGYERYCRQQKLPPPAAETAEETSYDRSDLESYWDTFSG